METSTVVVGVDTGGTFTDFIFRDGMGWSINKVLSTPEDPSKALLNGFSHFIGNKAKQIIHGSTVATNAILERKGVKTALITNKGFEDVIEIGRQNRSSIYDLEYRKTPHIIPKHLRFGIKARILCTGEVYEGLDKVEAKKVVRLIREAGAESVAVCFLFSYLKPGHENEIRELFQGLHIPVSLSHEILSEFREFERISTTVINAYVSPKMKRCLTNLTAELGERDSLRIMQSNGGSISAEAAVKESVRTIFSGPAGGVVGAYEMGKLAGFKHLITFDMGGTSTDVSLIDEKPSLILESRISDYPVKVPMIDIHTVGAGGGSIAHIDLGGSLKVGPESAGAEPGPICYGRGNQITVTDANLYLGRLISDYFLGGLMRLQHKRLNHFFIHLAKQLRATPLELAEGILFVANTSMERAIRVISVERGYDPREFTLFAFGGAGGMHAAFLAKILNIPRVVIPQNPGIFSAIGMVQADVVKDYSFTIMLDALQTDHAYFESHFSQLENRALNELTMEGVHPGEIDLERYLDMRYTGQSYEIMVPFDQNFIEGFHNLHKKTYGYRNSDMAIEVVNIRLIAKGLLEKPVFKKMGAGSERVPDNAVLEEKDIIFEGKPHKSMIIKRENLLSGNHIPGPAMVVEYSSTVIVPPFADAFIDDYGNLIMEIG